MRRILSEPLVLFLLLGVLLFAAYWYWKPQRGEVETIKVSKETIEALVQQDEMLRGRKITAEQRAALISSFIDDEVLLREARQAGYDESDPRVRKRLLSVMRYSMLANVPDPSRQQLEAYFNEKREVYRTAPAITFEHVYFAWDSENVPGNPEGFRKALARSDNPVAMGETFLPSNREIRATRPQILGSFGPTFADEVLQLEADGNWHGPIESNRGVHYVRVVEEHPAQLPTFEAIESYLRQEWLFIKNREAQQAKIDELRKRYRVEVDE